MALLTFTLLCLFFLPGGVWGVADALRDLAGREDAWQPVLLGFAAGVILHRLVIRRLTGLTTFLHELAHALVALLFLRRVTGFRVSWRRGGEVRHRGTFGGSVGTLLIGLGPYYLPLLTIPLLVAMACTEGGGGRWLTAAVGLSMGHHLSQGIAELRRDWTKGVFRSVSGERARTDIGSRGYLVSGITVAAMGTACLGAILTVLNHGFRGLPGCLADSLARSLALYRSLPPLVGSWF